MPYNLITLLKSKVFNKKIVKPFFLVSQREIYRKFYSMDNFFFELNSLTDLGLKIIWDIVMKIILWNKKLLLHLCRFYFLYL
jgi:hypothetical protein